MTGDHYTLPKHICFYTAQESGTHAQCPNSHNSFHHNPLINSLRNVISSEHLGSTR
jgi:hypothetical protein